MPSGSSPLKLVVVEDEGLFRDLLRNSLLLIDGMTVLEAFGDGEAAKAMIPLLQPDVLVLDIDLGNGCNGIELGIAMRKAMPKVGIVLLSNHQDPAYFTAIPRPEMRGWSYLLKKSVSDFPALERAIRGAADGLVVLDPQIIENLVARHDRAFSIGGRSREILALIAEGYSNQAISKKLCLAEKSVENQIGAIYRQLGIDTTNTGEHPRVQATLSYLRMYGKGFLDPVAAPDLPRRE